ncbi:MAG: peptide deformylase [Clostridiales bacterium]|nr:peptide deformylase [Clostridiales bacterium]
MAIRKIVKIGEDFLRKKSKPVQNFDEDLWQLLDDMKETMIASDGMGLAAPQIGVLRRIAVVEVNNAYFELINPQIIKSKGEDVEEEGCLSVGSFKGRVKRPYEITVSAFDRFGYPFTLTGEKWLARCICHEIDHLDGILFVDKSMDKDKYLKQGGKI